MTGWETLRDAESAKPYWADLQAFVEARRAHLPVYPPADQVYAALDLTPLDRVRVVIVGEEPPTGRGQAHGLAFSVPVGRTPPRATKNLLKVVEHDGYSVPSHGNLEHWAGQGVLLLSSVLTVGAGDPGSHRGQGWERFTDEVIRAVVAARSRVVFQLWGRRTHPKARLVPGDHHVIALPDPSTRRASLLRRAATSRPFAETNAYLTGHERDPIDWSLPDQ